MSPGARSWWAAPARGAPARLVRRPADTVADLEDLRRGARGTAPDARRRLLRTFVAERYALAHPPGRQAVLDSVVPQEASTPYTEALREGPGCWRWCAASSAAGPIPSPTCAVVRRRHDGPALLDMLVALSIGRPTAPGVPAVLHAAARGPPGGARRPRAGCTAPSASPASFLSQGLHAATLCADLRCRGPARRPLATRGRRSARRAGACARGLWPFDRATATGNGFACDVPAWPPIPAPPLIRAAPCPVPVLLLAGDHDLSTPLAWAQRERPERAVGRRRRPGAGHSVQSRASDPRVARALTRFLGG